MTGRICIQGYARILRGLSKEPATNAELVVLHRVTGAVIRAITRRLYDLGLIHVYKWGRSSKHGPAARVYGFGGLPDAPLPEGESAQWSSRPAKPKAELIAFGSLMKALERKRSLDELVDLTGMTAQTLRRNLAYMRSIGLIFIAGWQRRGTRCGGAPIAFYKVGIGKSDATRPRPITAVEKYRRHNDIRRARGAHMRFIRAICSNASVFSQAA